MAKTPRPSTETGIVIGQIFQDKYRVEEILGQGGMGIVARCTHLALNEQVAIKMLRQDVLLDHDATSRFMREAQAAVKLRSEYVARVSDVGTFENGVPYMVMEFLDGHDLGALLEEQHHIAVPWATDLILQAAEALAEAHSISIVHRDVKPTNLFVTWRPDGTSLIKVLDFGISKSPMGTDMQLTQTQSLLGTPAYMSPEQMRSARLVDQRTDIWSLGTVFYELIEGRRPFEAESFSEMCVKVAVDAPLPMMNAPPGLEDVVLRCLAKSPEQRYASMAELGRDLIPFARDQHQATMLVDRMFRMVGRANPGIWESASSSGNNRPMATPIPSRVRDVKSGAVVAEPATWKEASAPAIVPVDPRPRRSKAPWVVAFVVAAGAAAAGAFYANRHSGETPAKTELAPVPSSAATIKPEERQAAGVTPPDKPVIPEVKREVVPPGEVVPPAGEEIEIDPPKPPIVGKKQQGKGPRIGKVVKKGPPPEVKEVPKETPKVEPPKEPEPSPKPNLYDVAHPTK